MVETVVNQLDGSIYAGLNCAAASDAMALFRASQGAIHTTGAHIRALTHDTSGGLNLPQLVDVNDSAYSIATPQYNRLVWADFDAYLAQGRGAVLLVRYNVLANTKYDCFRHKFLGNHAIYIARKNPDGTYHGCDPGADGRYLGCPKGYQDYPAALLKLGAANLIAAYNRPLGAGYAQVMFTPRDSTISNQPAQPHVVLMGPASKEKNVMIAPAYGVTCVKRVDLKKKQPLFRSPGGQRVTAVSADAAVGLIGKAGPGWLLVLVGTGSKKVYKDGVQRPTGLYVPAAAGIIV